MTLCLKTTTKLDPGSPSLNSFPRGPAGHITVLLDFFFFYYYFYDGRDISIISSGKNISIPCFETAGRKVQSGQMAPTLGQSHQLCLNSSTG